MWNEWDAMCEMVLHAINYKKKIPPMYWHGCVTVASRWHVTFPIREYIFYDKISSESCFRDTIELKLSTVFIVELTGPVCLRWKPSLNEISNSGKEGNKN